MFVNRNRGRAKPANRGSVGTARSAIDTLSRVQQEKTVNGLAVQGYPCQYYSQKTVGLRCTCGVVHSPIAPTLPTEPGTIKVLDPDGNASPGHIRAMLQGSTISINRYGARPQGQNAPDDFVVERAVPNRPLIESLDQHNKTTDAADPFAEIVDPGEDLDKILDIDGNRGGTTFVETGAQSGCSVCLGTGFVGGYNFLNGLRAVYDTQQAWGVQGFILDDSVKPNVWKQAAADARAQLAVMLPRGATGVRALRLWNNGELLTEYSLLLQVSATEWVEPTAPNILNACDGTAHRFQITSKNRNLVFTHLELILDLQVHPVYVEWGRVTQTENPRLPENMESLSLVVSPTVPDVRLYDIVIDSVYERVWKVTSVTDFKDRQSRPMGWEVQARLVQKFEYPQLLSNSVLLHRRQEFTNALVPPVHNENWNAHEDTP